MAFPTTSILDDFNRSDEGPPPSANWTNVENGLKVVSNQARGEQVAAGNWSNWNVETFGPDTEAFVTMLSGSIALNAYVRLSSIDTNDDGYRVTAYASTVYVTRHDNGSGTQLGAKVAQTMGSSDKVGIEIVGSTITMYFDDGGAGWGSLGTRTDGTYSSAGYIGSRISGSALSADDFGGGTIAVVDFPPVPGQIHRWHRFSYIRM